MSAFLRLKSSHLQYDWFWRRTSLSHWHLLLVSKRKRRCWNTKSKLFFDMTLFEGGPRCQTKNFLVLYSYCTGISYWTWLLLYWRFLLNVAPTVLVFLAELPLTALTFLTALILTVLVFLTALGPCCTHISCQAHSYCTHIFYWAWLLLYWYFWLKIPLTALSVFLTEVPLAVPAFLHFLLKS